MDEKPCTCWKPSHINDTDCPRHGVPGSHRFHTPPRALPDMLPGDPGYKITPEDFEGRVRKVTPVHHDH